MAKLNISVETTVKNMLVEQLQKISDEFGIQLNSIQVDWLDISTPEGAKFLMQNISFKVSSREG